MPTTIQKEDLISPEEYRSKRKEYLQLRREIKSKRQFQFGQHATVTFENWDLIWIQVQEMLEVERGGEEQIDGELEAYNPLVPQGKDLVFTLMFGFEKEERAEMLGRLGWIEDNIYLKFDGETVRAVSASPTEDIDRTTPGGKTSAVHFLRFNLTPEQVEKFKTTRAPIEFSADHPSYRGSVVLGNQLVAELRKDF